MGSLIMNHVWWVKGEKQVIPLSCNRNKTKYYVEKQKCLMLLKTLKEVLAIKAQAIWIVLLYALKDNQRYWVLYYRKSVIWALFLLEQGNMLPKHGYNSNVEMHIYHLESALVIVTTRNSVFCNQSLCNWHATSCHLQLSL